jgi:hypothetical protein
VLQLLPELAGVEVVGGVDLQEAGVGDFGEEVTEAGLAALAEADGFDL